MLTPNPAREKLQLWRVVAVGGSVPWPAATNKCVPMHKTPAQMARSLRALSNASRLGLLRTVRILPGPNACEMVVAQFGIDYLVTDLPRLPLGQCARDHCECKYVPIGSDKLRRQYSTGKSLSPKSSD